VFWPPRVTKTGSQKPLQDHGELEAGTPFLFRRVLARFGGANASVLPSMSRSESLVCSSEVVSSQTRHIHKTNERPSSSPPLARDKMLLGLFRALCGCPFTEGGIDVVWMEEILSGLIKETLNMPRLFHRLKKGRNCFHKGPFFRKGSGAATPTCDDQPSVHVKRITRPGFFYVGSICNACAPCLRSFDLNPTPTVSSLVTWSLTPRFFCTVYVERIIPP